MSEKTAKKTKDRNVPEEEPLEAEETEPAAAEDETVEAEAEEEIPDEPEEAVEREAELEAEVAEIRDKLLRALAETENVRRRAVRDREDAHRFAITGFAREMLTVTDNLRRALDSVPAEARADNEVVDSVVVGVEMTERAMLTAFEKCGIKPIDAMGQKFNHNLHEALFEIEDKDQPAGTVVQVLEAGYVLNDRLLRPAKVGVSKGGPREAAEPDADAEAAPESTSKASTAYEKPAETGSQLDEKL